MHRITQQRLVSLCTPQQYTQDVHTFNLLLTALQLSHSVYEPNIQATQSSLSSLLLLAFAKDEH